MGADSGSRPSGPHKETAENLAAGALDWMIGATVDADGVRCWNHEHRVTPSTLDPHVGWAMGNAGIIRELLRYARAAGGADPSYAVSWPDHPPAVHLSASDIG